MTTKTMDGVTDIDVTHSEYIKKSDVEQYLITWRNLDIIRGLQDLPTINLSVIDEMIEEFKQDGFSYKTDLGNAYIAGLVGLKQRLSHKK